MNGDDTTFLPKHLDEQIKHPTDWLAPDDQRLVQDLRGMYQAYEHENAQSLHHVWGRLERETQKKRMQGMTTAQTAPLSLMERKQSIMSKSSLDSSRGGLQRILSLLVAVLVVAVLVGSAAFLFNVAGKKHTQSNVASGNLRTTSTPIVNSSGIYITYLTDGFHIVLSKLDARTHKPLWVYKIGPFDVGAPVVYGDVVYLNAMDEPTNQAHLIALNAETGKELWDLPFKAVTIKDENGNGPFNMGFLTAPVIVDGQVFVMNRAGTVFSFEAATGKANWTYTTGTSALVKQYYPGANGKKFAGSTIYDGGPPVISRGVLYGALHNIYFAVNMKTGKRIWSSTLTEQDQLFTSLQVVDGIIYTASYIASGHNAGMSLQSYVYAFNAKDGSQIWKYTTKNWVTDAPSISDGHVYFIERIPAELTFSGNGQSTLRVLNTQGNEVWHKDYNVDIAGSPTAGEGYVSVNIETYDHTNGQILTHTLYVYDARGNGWEKDVEANPITIQNGVLYTQSGRQIIAYDIKSQKELWRGQYGVDLVDTTGNHIGRLYQIVVVL